MQAGCPAPTHAPDPTACMINVAPWHFRRSAVTGSPRGRRGPVAGAGAVGWASAGWGGIRWLLGGPGSVRIFNPLIQELMSHFWGLCVLNLQGGELFPPHTGKPMHINVVIRVHFFHLRLALHTRRRRTLL